MKQVEVQYKSSVQIYGKCHDDFQEVVELFVQNFDIYSEIGSSLCVVVDGEILSTSNARLIRDGAIVYTGKINSIFREKNQAKQVSAGQECGITLRDFNDYQKKDIIEVFNSTSTERMI